MGKEELHDEFSPEQLVDMTVSTVLGETYQKLPQRRVWVSTGDTPVITALDMSQRSRNLRGVSFVTLRAFVGTEPPEDLLDWHLGIRLESVPGLLTVSGEHIDELPRHLEEKDDGDKTKREAKKIAHAAKLVFGRINTLQGINDLITQLDNIRPSASRVLGITIQGRHQLGIS